VGLWHCNTFLLHGVSQLSYIGTVELVKRGYGPCVKVVSEYVEEFLFNVDAEFVLHVLSTKVFGELRQSCSCNVDSSNDSSDLILFFCCFCSLFLVERLEFFIARWRTFFLFLVWVCWGRHVVVFVGYRVFRYFRYFADQCR
jgi:hypothetical protein